MKAWVVEEDGAAGIQEVPRPDPGPGEVRLRVIAAALNHLDVFVQGGLTGPGLRPHAYPAVTGSDCAGTIDHLGAGVEGWETGQRVIVYPGLGCGMCEHCRQGEISRCGSYQIWGEQVWGGLAEYAVAPAANLLALPTRFDPVLAAAAPVAFTTAWRVVIATGRVRPGELVLVVGIGGGVATAALRLARWAGARVLVTSGHDWKIEKALALGAAAGVNHRREAVDRWVDQQTGGRGVDMVVDSVGAPTWRASINSLAPGGRLCVCGATGGDQPAISIRELYQAHRQILGAPLGGWADFESAMGAVFRGDVVPVIHAVRPLSEVGAALAELEAGRQFGKLVVTC